MRDEHAAAVQLECDEDLRGTQLVRWAEGSTDDTDSLAYDDAADDGWGQKP